MLKRILAKFRPTPASSMAVALLGLVVALGSTGWAANGGAFILGVINSATARTALVANFNGTALQLSNTSAGAAATALTLSVAAGHPPMKVNTVAKVTNLNADYVDGLDSATLTRVLNVPYSLAPGAVSAPITVPANRPVQLVGVNLTSPYPGVGQASLLHVSGQDIQWAAYSYSNTTITSSHTSAAGSFIVSIDFSGFVNIEVAGPNTIQVHNVNINAQSGSVSLMW